MPNIWSLWVSVFYLILFIVLSSFDDVLSIVTSLRHNFKLWMIILLRLQTFLQWTTLMISKEVMKIMSRAVRLPSCNTLSRPFVDSSIMEVFLACPIQYCDMCHTLYMTFMMSVTLSLINQNHWNCLNSEKNSSIIYTITYLRTWWTQC